jgi:hypothetical protein
MPPLSAVSTHSSSGASVESVEQPWGYPGRYTLDVRGIRPNNRDLS